MNAISRNNRVFLVLAMMCLLFAATALARGSGGRGGRGPGHGMGHGEFGPEHRLEILTEKLELTDEQTAAIGGILEAGRTERVALHKEMMRLRNELEGEMLKDEPSDQAALDLVGKMGDLRTEIQTNRMKNRLAVREQLTEEQRDKMLLMKDRGGKGHGRKGARRPGHRFGGNCVPDCDGHGRGRAQGQ